MTSMDVLNLDTLPDPGRKGLQSSVLKLWLNPMPQLSKRYARIGKAIRHRVQTGFLLWFPLSVIVIIPLR